MCENQAYPFSDTWKGDMVWQTRLSLCLLSRGHIFKPPSKRNFAYHLQHKCNTVCTPGLFKKSGMQLKVAGWCNSSAHVKELHQQWPTIAKRGKILDPEDVRTSTVSMKLSVVVEESKLVDKFVLRCKYTVNTCTLWQGPTSILALHFKKRYFTLKG